jgi:hypothetical protein
MKFLRIPAFALALLGAVQFASCDQKKEGITTDMVNNSATADGSGNTPVAEIAFEQDTFRFGEVMEGEKVAHSFKFKNTGKNNLIISGASASCGCTVPEWPKAPIPPGESGSIDVVFNTQGRPGAAKKAVTVSANTEPASCKIYIVGEVKPAK